MNKYLNLEKIKPTEWNQCEANRSNQSIVVVKRIHAHRQRQTRQQHFFSLSILTYIFTYKHMYQYLGIFIETEQNALV